MERITLVNLTPHTITIQLTDGTRINIEPSGTIARVETTYTVVNTVNGIPVVQTTFGQITGLPEPQENTIYIASTLVTQAANKLGRYDVVAPDTGPTAIRNDKGQIDAVTRFQQF